MKTAKYWINYLYSIIASFTIVKNESRLIKMRILPLFMAMAFGGVLNLLIYPFIREPVFSIIFGLSGGLLLGALWMLLEGFEFNPTIYKLEKNARMLYFLLIIWSVLLLFVGPILLLS